VTDTVQSTTGTVTDTVQSTTGTVTDTVESTTGTVGETVDGTLGTVGETVDGTLGTVGGPTDAGVPGLPPLPPVTSDPIIGRANATTSGSTADGTRTGVSSPQRVPLNIVLAVDVQAASARAAPPDVARGTEPGPSPSGRLPSPFDAATAASRSHAEAGATSVMWALLALLVLLPAMDDRWLQFVHAVQRSGAILAPDGRPG
ncbi:MAG TPA: hypothetical protein VNP90_04110, partial [Actinomycetota bacterium]|nr:hypothetical protein [Actinomycetota bacterium]